MLMIKVICGKKGVGKTRALVDSANSFLASASGDIVFISGKKQLMHDLSHKIRLINLYEFPVNISSSCTFLGFICGIISANYDIKEMYIDDLVSIVKNNPDALREMFDGMKEISEKFNIDFHVSIEGDPDSMPDFVKECY
ncbi:MAG: hypothetical protein GX194_14990 [Clostridium sp.]|nr:hypothetical protein [Clostridium sp.]